MAQNQAGNLTAQDVIQVLFERMEQLESRINGLHLVLNQISNEIRNSNPDAATRIADAISALKLKEEIDEPKREVLEAYRKILLYRKNLS